MQKFEVEINNEILGNSKHVMRLDQIARFNLVAKALAIQCTNDGQEHSSGMWTVRPHTANKDINTKIKDKGEKAA